MQDFVDDKNTNLTSNGSPIVETISEQQKLDFKKKQEILMQLRAKRKGLEDELQKVINN